MSAEQRRAAARMATSTFRCSRVNQPRLCAMNAGPASRMTSANSRDGRRMAAGQDAVSRVNCGNWSSGLTKSFICLLERWMYRIVSLRSLCPATSEWCRCPFQHRTGEWRNGASAPPRTTHDLLSRKICYRFHPFHDVEVALVRYLRKTDSSILVIKLRGGVQVAIPEWMLNPRVCDQLKTEDQPRISVCALLDLRRLIDAQSFQNAPKDRRFLETREAAARPALKSSSPPSA